MLKSRNSCGIVFLSKYMASFTESNYMTFTDVVEALKVTGAPESHLRLELQHFENFFFRPI